MANSLNTIDKLIDCLQLQVANLPTYQVAVGATVGDVNAVLDAHANLEYIRDYADLIDANKKAVTQIKQAVYNGDINDTISAFPVFPAGDFPSAAVAGELERAQIRNRRFKLGPGYTEEIGVALGIAGSPQTIDPGTIIPTIEVTASQSDYLFSIVVTNRGQSDMWDVQTSKVGANQWSTAKSSTGKSTDVTMPPNDPEAPGPYQIQIRVRLKRNGSNYGQLSPIAQVTVNP